MKTTHKNINLSDEADEDAQSKDKYFGDFFQDEVCVLEDMDNYEYLLAEEPANDDIWDVMSIYSEDIGEMSGWLNY